MNMLPRPDGKLKIFYLASSGSALAAQEIEVNGGIRLRVRHPATFRSKEDETGFEFTPVIFVEDEMILYATSLLGETDMPDNVRPSYLDYIRRRENRLPN
jgi:hypothetical protein